MGHPKVYPRVYGGTPDADGMPHDAEGLSPRVRGNLLHALDSWPEIRSIPACTGEPPSVSRTWSRVTVYPRVYGGTLPDFSLGAA